MRGSNKIVRGQDGIWVHIEKEPSSRTIITPVNPIAELQRLGQQAQGDTILQNVNNNMIEQLEIYTQSILKKVALNPTVVWLRADATKRAQYRSSARCKRFYKDQGARAAEFSSETLLPKYLFDMKETVQYGRKSMKNHILNMSRKFAKKWFIISITILFVVSMFRVNAINFHASKVEQVNPENMVLWMPFDDATVPIPDESGNGNTGVLNGATWVSDIGGTYVFDGSDYIGVLDDPTLDITGPLTVSAWVNRESMSGSPIYRYVVGKGANFRYEPYLLLYANSDDTYRFKVYNGVSNYEVSAPASPDWHLVTGVFDGVSIFIYIDGALAESTSFPTTSLVTNNRILGIGGSIWGRFFNGDIDDVRIYNKALTLSEVNQLYADTAGNYLPKNTLTIDNIGGGSVTLDPTGGNYPEGTIVTLTASPASGWKFSRWTGDIISNENPETIMMDSNKDVTAIFEVGFEQYLAYNYTILNFGMNYYAVGSDGRVDFEGTDAYSVVQKAINATCPSYLGNRGAILLGSGYYNFGSNSLLIPNYFHLEGIGAQGVVLTSEGVPIIKPMWTNFTFGAWISKMYLYGEFSATHGIYWEIDNATLPPDEMYDYMLKVTDLMIRGTEEYPVYIKTRVGSNTICLFDNVRTTSKWYIERVFDSMFSNIYCSGADLRKITTNHFENWYIGGGYDPQLRIYGDSETWPNKGNIFVNVRVDNPLGTALSVEGYSSYNQFLGCEFANLNQMAPPNTYSSVRFIDYTHHNLITGSFMGNYRTTSPKFKFLIEETANVHNNSYVGNTYQQDSAGTSLINVINPTNSNFEHRAEEYLATATSTLSETQTHYCSPIGLYSSSPTEHVRTVYWQRSGTITNFWFKSTIAPGEGKSITAYIRIDESSDYLPVAISDSDFQGINLGTIHISAGQTISIKCVPQDNPETGIAWFAFEFYPDLEEVVGP